MKRPITPRMRVDCLLDRIIRQFGTPLLDAFGEPLLPGNKIDFDHIHDEAEKGPHIYQNLRPLNHKPHIERTKKQTKQRKHIDRLAKGGRKHKRKHKGRKMQSKPFRKYKPGDGGGAQISPGDVKWTKPKNWPSSFVYTIGYGDKNSTTIFPKRHNPWGDKGRKV